MRAGVGTSRPLVVESRRPVDAVTVEVRLAAADGAALPRWAPGAHVDLVLPGGLVRPYSLCGDPRDTATWRLLVRRAGRASAYVHDQLQVGDVVHARGPRDRFVLGAAARYLFVASGAGIAPLLPMARWVAAARIYPWQLLHLDGGRSLLADEVQTLGTTADDFALVADAVLAAPDGTAVYACGSARFVDAVADLAGQKLDLHRQQFDRPEPVPGGTPACELVLARRGDTIPVPAGTSLLDALLDAGVPVPVACGVGICGACIVPLLEGTVRHRDSILTDAERATGRSVVTCVSAADSARLVLDV